ncbi:hypothetical protein E2553_19385 [Paraburkholderia dipogonis]|uniref:RES domain-containing protein n=1 Tax=Paraburkholderia dipogonis TaxID=1211383 RepID=A0A4Y8NBG4_9BURK|nr:RES family NAD+ phosphorylase [Paraburkholderia dipogonis]TFE47001.1 hypothetical protein E2553_19385 [Paraburkholderia dipogonis]
MRTDENSRVCGLCIKDWVLASEIEADGQVRECVICGTRRRTWSLAFASKRVHEVLEERYRPGDCDFAGEQDGEPLTAVIAEILGEIDDRLAESIADYVIDNFNGDPRDPDPPAWDAFDSYVEVPGFDVVGHAHDLWEEYLRSLKSGSRFFNDDARKFLADLFYDIDELQTWAHGVENRQVIHELPVGTAIYRARIAGAETIERIALAPGRELHAAPPDRCNPGRMNVERTPAFYGSFDPQTCVAELRPALSTKVCYAQFRTTRPLCMLDFARLERSYNVKLSFFQDDFDKRAVFFALLRRLHTLIQAPVRPGEEHEYLATQVLAEYLATVHRPRVDGLVFGSVQHAGGRNIVLFGSVLGKFLSGNGWTDSPLELTPDSVRIMSVEKVEYKTTEPLPLGSVCRQSEFEQNT